MDLMPRGRAMTPDEVEKFIRRNGDLEGQRRTEPEPDHARRHARQPRRRGGGLAALLPFYPARPRTRPSRTWGALHWPAERQDGPIARRWRGLSQGWPVPIRRTPRFWTVSEKLTSLSKEDDRFRKSIEDLQAIVQRTAGTLTEMDKRIAERFAEYDKRLAETDRRVQLQIELAVRNALDKRNDKALG